MLVERGLSIMKGTRYIQTQIQKGIEDKIVPVLQQSKTFSSIKTLLHKEADEIASSMASYAGVTSKLMHTKLKSISYLMTSAEQQSFYYDLETEVLSCKKLQTAVSGNFGNYDIVDHNICYIYELSEFIGYIKDHMTDIFD